MMRPFVTATRPLLSVVVPMFNEEVVVPSFFQEVTAQLGDLSINWEIICVNDGSSDHTLDVLLRYAADDARIKVIDLSRNFGKEAALTAGLDHARGDAVVIIDADLQDPPQLIGPMLDKWRDGFHVVHAARVSRQSDSFLKRTTGGMFYKLYNRLGTLQIPHDVGDFRLLDRKVVDALQLLRERNRFMKGILAWPGFRCTSIEYERPPRAAASTKFNYWQLWNLALEGLTSFSTVPLRMWTYLGLLVAALSMVYAALLIFRTLVQGADVPGYASLMVAILFLGGIQLISLGVIGEYLGRVYQEVKQRPIYLVNNRYGFDTNNDAPIEAERANSS